MILDANGWELDPTPWAANAACTGRNPALWFPGPGGNKTAIHQAKAVCAQCPVNNECLTYALRWRIEHGIWGGTTYDERRHNNPVPRPKRLPAHHGTTTRYGRGCRCSECTEANSADKHFRKHRAELNG